MPQRGVRLVVILLALLIPPLASAAASSGRDQTSAGNSVPIRSLPNETGVMLISSKVGEPPPLDDETIQDLAYYAKQHGEDASAVAARHAGVTEFAEFTTQLEQSHSDLFVRAGLSERGSDAPYWIKLTRAPDDTLIESIRSLSVDVTVEYGSPASAAELARLAELITTSLAERGDAIRWSGTRYDFVKDILTVRYTPQPSSDLAAAALTDALTFAAKQFNGELPVAVQFEETSYEATAEETVQGGRNLNLASGPAECTGGFTAVRNGNRGTLTARHCANNVEYNGIAGVISTDPAVPDYDAVDFQFHRTLTGNGHDTNKQFRATCTAGSCDRTVTAVANAPIDSTVCHWGRTSGYSCATVADTDQCETLSGHRWCGLDVTDEDISSGGDSGGPWFLGNTARGTHSGALSGVESYFTRVGRLYFLDATILQD